MTSSLSGIYTAQRSIMLNQAALSIVNNNISNINTEGYSKQRLDVSQITLKGPGFDNPYNAAQAGAGAYIDNISRNRDSFLDTYYRSELTKLNYYNEYSESTGLIEDITNELSDGNLTSSFNDFYNAANQISLNPTDSVARSDFIQKAIDVTTNFNRISDQLTNLRENLVGDGSDPLKLEVSKINTACNDLNEKLRAVADLNKSISLSTAQGITPNGLLDQRDQLLDDISKYIPITVNQATNNTVSIKLGNVDLVRGSTQIGSLKTTIGTASDPAVVGIYDADGNVITANASDLITSGKIGAILDLGSSDPNKLTINNYIQNLNTLANQFAQQVNTINRGGQYIDKTATPPVLTSVSNPPAVPFDIFVEDTSSTQADYTTLNASNIVVNQDVIKDPFKIAAASNTSAANETGDGSNALLMSQSRNTSIAALSNQTVENFISSLNGSLGIQINNIDNNIDSQSSIVDQIKQKRESSSGVNLDEELVDLIKYQRAYEASAKVFGVVDATIQTVIGLVD